MFLLANSAADALFERLTEASMVPDSETVPHAGSSRDALALLLWRTGVGTTLQTARILNAARAFAAVAMGRRNEITWPRLLIGLLYFGSQLRADAKIGALPRILAELAEAAGGVDSYVTELAGRELRLASLDWRKAEAASRLSPSAEKALTDAAALTDGRPISDEALLAALLRDTAHDGDASYRKFFGCDRATLLERLLTSADGRARPADLATFRRWLELSVTAAAPELRTAEPPAAEPPADQPPAPEPAPDGPPPDEPPAAEPGRTGPLVAATLNDTVRHGHDFLNVRQEARAFARLIASRAFEPPLAIGVFGHWGSGKTFFMEKIAEELERFAGAGNETGDGGDGPVGALRHIVTIRFNAWHYMETNVWASLVEVIFRELDGWLRRSDGTTAKPDDSVDRLFESLSTAQAERLEAIETVAERIRARETARQEVRKAEESETARWRDVAMALARQKPGAFETAIDALGLSGLASEAEKLRAAIGAVDAAASDGTLLWQALRTRAGDWRMLALLIAGVIVLPLGAAWLGKAIAGEPLVPALTGFVATATAWVTWLARRGQSAVEAMRTLKRAFDETEQTRARTRQETLAQHHDRVGEAERLLERAEAAAADAQRRLHEGSATGRISTFIRSRAESDIYSRHLGIIATVRRDFEQLTALMAESREQARAEQKALEQQRRDTETRIAALRTRYKLAPPDAGTEGPEPDAATASALKPVKEALDRLERLNAAGNPLGHPIGRIVLFIDDLDRCPPAKVYAVLQAVHLFLSFPLFVVVVGVDTRWMEASLTRQLKGLVDGSNGATPQDYLEKIFQIPYWTRRMDADASRGFVTGVLGRLRTGETPADEKQTPADRGEGDDADDDVTTGKAISDTPAAGGTTANDKTTNTEEEEDEDADDDLIDEEDERGDGGDTVPTRFGPVVLTGAERIMIEDLAPEAGRSPRQLLRFVNVYGLIKSVTREDGSPEIDPAADPLRFKALLTQLAIATGSPRAAAMYFRVLERHAVAGDEGFFAELFDTLDVGPQRERFSITDALYRYFKSVGAQPKPTNGNRFDIGEADAETGLQAFKALVATASIARRYTFAAPDAAPVAAVTAAEPPDDA